MAFFAYVLASEKTGRRYIGSTADVNERVRRHNCGHSKATRGGIPWKLVYVEEFSSRVDAVAREMYLKTGAGRDEIGKILHAQ